MILVVDLSPLIAHCLYFIVIRVGPTIYKIWLFTV